MQTFPKFKYHATESPVIVQNEDQEDALGSGWEDTPAAHLDADGKTEAEILKAETEANAKQDQKDLARVDLATAQRTVRKAPIQPLEKTSGDDEFGGDWTQAGDGKAYPATSKLTDSSKGRVVKGADPVVGANAVKGAR